MDNAAFILLTQDGSVKGVDLGEVYSENVVAKIVQVAQRGFKQKVRGYAFSSSVDAHDLRPPSLHIHIQYPKKDLILGSMKNEKRISGLAASSPAQYMPSSSVP
jgi:hypothetical protein